MLRQRTATGMRSRETENCQCVKPRVCKPRNCQWEAIAAIHPCQWYLPQLNQYHVTSRYRIGSQSTEGHRTAPRDTPIYKCSDREQQLAWEGYQWVKPRVCKPRNRTWGQQSCQGVKGLRDTHPHQYWEFVLHGEGRGTELKLCVRSFDYIIYTGRQQYNGRDDL
jgi:hypothetical protein